MAIAIRPQALARCGYLKSHTEKPGANDELIDSETQIADQHPLPSSVHKDAQEPKIEDPEDRIVPSGRDRMSNAGLPEIADSMPNKVQMRSLHPTVPRWL